MNRLGVNILARYVRDWGKLRAFLQALDPALILIMDDFGRALELRSAHPSATIVYRQYNENDMKWHERNVNISPQQWINAHRQFSQNGIVVQLYNEPDGQGQNEGMINYCREVIRLCPPDMKIATPLWSVGNPLESNVDNGYYDDLLRDIVRGNHKLATHEYAQQSTINERPYRIGRIERLLKRCDTIGIARPQPLILEYGRDVAGTKGANGDGWRRVFNAAQYGQFLIDGMDVYKRLNALVAVYCAGDGAGEDGNRDWITWQIEDIQPDDAKPVRDAMIAYGRNNPIVVQPPPPPPPTPPTQPPPEYWQPPVRYTVAAIDGASINVRSTPFVTGSIRGSIVKGDVIEASSNVWSNGGHSWRRITSKNGAALVGYFASQYATLVTSSTRPPNDPDLVVLDVPYLSQSSIRNNACGVASCLMVQRFLWRQAYGLTPNFPTVNATIPITPLANEDKPISTTALVNLYRELGIDSAVVVPFTVEDIETAIRAGLPVIPLLHYGYMVGEPEKHKFGHFSPVVGLTGAGFYIHDTYLKGAKWWISRENLALALSKTTEIGAAGNPNQVVAILKAA